MRETIPVNRLDAGQLRDMTARVTALEAFSSELSDRLSRLELAQPTERIHERKEMAAIQLRASRIEAADPKWDPIRKRWPKLSKHPRALEAYERHVKTLDGEPSRKHLVRKSKAFSPTRHYMRPAIEAMGYTRAEAQAYMWFFLQADLATFVEDRGIIFHVHA